MILFTLLAITAIIAVIMAIIVVGTIGGATIILFGDIIVCIAIFVMIIKWLITRNKKK